jgi:hypothetical protein
MGVFVEGVIDPLPVMLGEGVVIVKAQQLPELTAGNVCYDKSA